MIPADEVGQIEPEHAPLLDVVETENLILDDDEIAAYHFVDSELDEFVSSFKGSIFLKPVPGDIVTDKVIASLKKHWEAGGWIVDGFRTADGGWLMAFARGRAGTTIPTKRIVVALQARDELPAAPLSERPRIAAGAPAMLEPLLVRMPTRGRPEQALGVLELYRELAETPIRLEVVIDEDDDTMNNSQVLQRLCELDCVITVGRHRNKIDAVNGGRVNDWAVLALASDDMVPVARGYDRRILDAMDRHFPLRDGAIYFNDGYNRDHVLPGRPVLCTMPIMGRHLWEQFGYVYYPEYGSLYSDDEQTQILTAMKRLAFVDQIIVEHRHHAAGKAAHDALYQFNDNKYGAADRALFETRAKSHRGIASQFAFDAPPLWLSILVCSTPARAPMLRRLEEHLRAQMRRFPRQVEICVDDAHNDRPIGEKRNGLLERAVGHYVAFIDDDDWVPHDYVDRIIDALERAHDADCVRLAGLMTTNGEQPERFEHSIHHDGWYRRDDGVHVRTPNHLNPVKRELALQARFPSKSFGEDHDYSKALRPLLKSEAPAGDAPLYFYWFRTKERMGA